ncbi:MAG TPA: pectin acetylesterase-family hydrolase [Nannocystis sp.]
MRSVFLVPLCFGLLVPACGEDGGSVDSATGGGSDGGSSTSGGAEPTSGDAPTTGEDASTGTSGASTTGEPTTGAEETTGEPSPWDGEPLPEAPPGEWIWVDFPDALCRDGSTTGIGVRYGTGDGLVIYFMGGGACFNVQTCALNPARFSGSDFEGSSSGIFDPSANNPVGDWSFVFVPYCTGDVHAGDRPDQNSPAGIQQFVGYRNVAAYLERIVPTFTGVEHVLVTGESAGGFGAAFNYDRIADAFPGTAVTLLDDSGPPLGFEVVPLCLQQQWSDLWGLEDTIPADCEGCFPSQGGGVVNIGRYIAKKHKDQRLALISSTGDSVIRFFFGFGANDCSAIIPNTPQEAFEAALLDLREKYFNEPPGVWGSFFVGNSEQHTWLSGSYYSASTNGVSLVEWVGQLIAGEATHVGP